MLISDEALSHKRKDRKRHRRLCLSARGLEKSLQKWCFTGWKSLLAESICWSIALRNFEGYVRCLLADKDGNNVRFYGCRLSRFIQCKRQNSCDANRQHVFSVLSPHTADITDSCPRLMT